MKQQQSFFAGFGFSSKLFFLLAIIILAPIACLVVYPEEFRYLPAFSIPAAATAAIGVILHKRKQSVFGQRSVSRQHDVIVVVALWFYAFGIGGMPFLLSGQLSPLRAVFESVSGWTATGFTTMDVTATPKIFLLYRSWMQFCGGIGFVLLILLFADGTNAMKLFSAEGHPDKLEPNLVSTARFTMKIYLGFTLTGTVMYRVFGMSWFDALNHAMSAMATGGFSTKPESIGSFDSVPIEAVTIILMLVGGTNFAILALLFKRRKRDFFRVGEIRFAAALLAAAIPVLAFAGLNRVYSSFSESLRSAVFHSVSAITSTGFSIDGFSSWQPSMTMLLIILMIIGGGSGSTAGGMKYSRVYILWKSFTGRLEQKFLPERSVHQVSIYRAGGKTPVPEKEVLEIHHFALIYLGTFLLGTLLLSFDGVPLEQAFFDFSSALGTIGLSTGITSASASNYVLTIQLIGMVLARLEIYIVMIFFFSGLKQIQYCCRAYQEKKHGKK